MIFCSQLYCSRVIKLVSQKSDNTGLIKCTMNNNFDVEKYINNCKKINKNITVNYLKPRVP